MKIEYFAVLLPDFLIFEEDLQVRNQVQCYYLMGLGNYGLGKKQEARLAFEKALLLNQNHMECIRFLDKEI